MKIKTKKQFTLPQLIEWAIDNNVDNNIFIGKKNLYNVGFNKNGLMYFNTTKPIPIGEIFTVEVEEEITEDTELDLIERFIGGMGYACYKSHGNMTIKECLKRTPSDCTTTHFYIENDDRELILIWRDGKLI